MKINKNIIAYSLMGYLTIGLSISCSDSFLDQAPPGVFAQGGLTNKTGIEGMLINAYASMHGPAGSWYTSPVNWVWGSVTAGEAYKGSEKNDQSDVNPIERFEVLPSSPLIRSKWDATYNGVGQANKVLSVLPEVTDLSDADRTRIEGEAKFLRGFFHFEAKKVFGNVPYVDETASKPEDFKIPNSADIWDKIVADFKFAYDNLLPGASAVGRANKWAAASYLAKAYMFQNKFTEAKAVLDDVIANGTTQKGVKYALAPKFQDNFSTATENNSETIFSMQYSVNDGSTTNGNYEMTLNYPAPNFNGCCGFYQPTQDLVNSYKTDAAGLPLIDSYNASDVTSDEALLSTDPFVPYAGTLDPRLDWTVGRRGIPYLDWSLHPGHDWIRDVSFSGPYSPKKNTWSKSEQDAKTASAAGWGWNNNAKNFTYMRFADVLLMAAEAEAEVGSLAKAADYVNMIRTRAANPEGFVYKFKDDTKPADGFSTVPAANYVITTYPAFADKATALKAIHFERKLELAMEGHRFFDLVRWGTAEAEINAFLAFEGAKRVACLGGTTFTAKNKYMPIPEYAINQSFVDGVATLAQNPGY
jgi:hypothetical protein